jgi:hypothetical protein
MSQAKPENVIWRWQNIIPRWLTPRNSVRWDTGTAISHRAWLPATERGFAGFLAATRPCKQLATQENEGVTVGTLVATRRLFCITPNSLRFDVCAGGTRGSQEAGQ